MSAIRSHLSPCHTAADERDRAVRDSESPRESCIGLGGTLDDLDPLKSELGSRASADVLSESDRLQVRNVHASAIAAEMIKHKAVWNRTVNSLPCESVRQGRSEHPVTVGIPASRPDEAARSGVSSPSLIELQALQPRIVTAYESLRLSLDLTPSSASHWSDLRDLTAAAFARVIDRLLVHAASLIEVVNGGRGPKHPRLPNLTPRAG